MTKRRIIAALSAVCLAALVFLLWKPVWTTSETSGLLKAQKNDLQQTHPKLAEAVPGDHPDSVNVEFDQVPLPEALDQLVKQTGITVTADLDDKHDRILVNMQAFLPPAEALKMIAAESGLELLKTDRGWWLRPEGSPVAVIYQPSLMVMDDGRTQRLLDSLRKIIGAKSGGSGDASPESAAITSKGIRVVAPKTKQGHVSAYLNSFFTEKVASKSEEVLFSGIPPLPQK